MERKTINYTFKILYAIGIIQVVMSHCYNGGIALFNELFSELSFALAMFMFASGYFYKPENENNVSQYILKKVKTLLIPLFAYNIIYTIIAINLIPYGFTGGYNLKIYNLFLCSENYYNLGGWFVLPLFGVQVVNVLFRKFINLCNIKVSEILLFLLSLGVGIYGVYLSSGDSVLDYSFIIHIMYFLPFYCLGILYKKYESYDKLPNYLYFPLIIIFNLIIMILNGFEPSYIPVQHKYIDGAFNCYFCFIVGILGIAFWLRISKILTPILEKNKTMNLIADNTYSIMINHLLGFFLLNGVFAILHKYLGLFKAFDIALFKTKILYIYIPQNIEQFCIIYLLFGIGFSIFIKLLFEYIIKKFENLQVDYSVDINCTNYTYKILYAIAIFFVVASSCNNGGFSVFLNWFYPATFATALFIFTSGYFYNHNAQNDSNFALQYIAKKFKHLIVTFLVCNIIYILILMFLQNFGFFSDYEISFQTFLRGTPLNPVGWFILSLFTVQLLNVGIRRLLTVMKVNINEFVYFIFSLFIGIYGVYLMLIFEGDHSWFVRLLYFIPFYSLGILYRKIEKYDVLSNWKYYSIIFLLTLVTIFIAGHQLRYDPRTLNFLDGHLNYYFCFVVTILAIAFWLRIAKNVTPILTDNKIINLLSNNTYSIMMNHILGFMVLKSVFAILYQYTNLCTLFNMSDFKQNVYYFYTSKYLWQFNILYLIFGIIFALFIQKIINIFKAFIGSKLNGNIK